MKGDRDRFLTLRKERKGSVSIENDDSLLHGEEITMKYYNGLTFRHYVFAFLGLNLLFFFGVQLFIALKTKIPCWSL
jgi:hypothetical protein